MKLSSKLATVDHEIDRHDLLALHCAASLLVQGFSADVGFLEEALARGDADSAQTIHREVHARVTTCLRVVDGINSKLAERCAFFLLVEDVAALASPDHVAAGVVDEVRQRLIAQVGSITYVRLHWRIIAPALERRTSEAAISRALDVCASTGPGKRGGAEPKASALANVWKEISGEKVDAHSFESSLSKARSASRKSKP